MDLYPYCLWRWLVPFDINLQLISELESESVNNEGDKLLEEVSTALQWHVIVSFWKILLIISQEWWWVKDSFSWQKHEHMINHNAHVKDNFTYPDTFNHAIKAMVSKNGI